MWYGGKETIARGKEIHYEAVELMKKKKEGGRKGKKLKQKQCSWLTHFTQPQGHQSRI